MPYAINIADTLYPDRLALLQLALRPYLPSFEKARVVSVDPERFDGRALVLECDDERGAAIISLIRARCKPWEWRCYYSAAGEGGWKRV